MNPSEQSFPQQPPMAFPQHQIQQPFMVVQQEDGRMVMIPYPYAQYPTGQPQPNVVYPYMMAQPMPPQAPITSTPQQPSVCQRTCAFKCKATEYLKANRLFTTNLILVSIISILVTAIMIMNPQAVFSLLMKIFLGCFVLVAQAKKKFLPLTFLTGALLIDVIHGSMTFALINSVYEYHHRHQVESGILSGISHILELVLFCVSLVEVKNLYRSLMEAKMETNTEVTPVTTENDNTPLENQLSENYSRLNEEEEGRMSQITQPMPVQPTQYYPKLDQQ